MTSVPGQYRRWMVTVNNYSQADIEAVKNMGELAYLAIGYEVAPTTGTRHMQCYAEFKKHKRMAAIKQMVPRANLQKCDGTAQQCRDYCIKGGAFEEIGEISSERQGKRSDIEELRDMIKDGERSGKVLRDKSVAACKYPALVQQLLIDHQPKPEAPNIELKQWQTEVTVMLDEDPPDREIYFYVDPVGGAGKSTFARYLEAKFDDVYVIKPGRYQDMAYELPDDVKILVVDCPRSRHEVMQYNILEDVKDGRVTNSKYQSYQKRLGKVHLLVFCNEFPDPTKLSADRYKIKNLSDEMEIVPSQFLT